MSALKNNHIVFRHLKLDIALKIQHKMIKIETNNWEVRLLKWDQEFLILYYYIFL